MWRKLHLQPCTLQVHNGGWGGDASGKWAAWPCAWMAQQEGPMCSPYGRARLCIGCWPPLEHGGPIGTCMARAPHTHTFMHAQTANGMQAAHGRAGCMRDVQACWPASGLRGRVGARSAPTARACMQPRPSPLSQSPLTFHFRHHGLLPGWHQSASNKPISLTTMLVVEPQHTG